MKLVMLTLLASSSPVASWAPSPRLPRQRRPRLGVSSLAAKPAGTFFNPVPEDNEDNEDNEDDISSSSSSNTSDEATEDEIPSLDTQVMELLRQRKAPSLASQPSTINGKPTAGQGFGKQSPKDDKGSNGITPPGDSKPFVGIGPRLNDPTQPEYDDQGYTLYSDERTGTKSRVFEALVDYPCKFTMKIVGAKEGSFVEDIISVVADSCEVPAAEIDHSVRMMGKWASVTVEAPVDSAEMLYQLYENVDRDPRVKFKF
jgi:putative lipoic acid-binding regulatory protein